MRQISMFQLSFLFYLFNSIWQITHINRKTGLMIYTAFDVLLHLSSA